MKDYPELTQNKVEQKQNDPEQVKDYPELTQNEVE